MNLSRYDLTLMSMAANFSGMQANLEYLIGATPTGERRNLLTQINIDMMLVDDKIQSALQSTPDITL